MCIRDRYQSRRDKQVEIDGKKMEIEEIAGELLVAMSRMKTPAQPGTTEAPGKKARFVRGLQQGKSILRRVEHWADGMDGATQTGEGLVGGVVLKRDEFGAGPFTKYIWRPVKDALNKYRIERANYTKQYSEMLSRLDIDKKPITSVIVVTNTLEPIAGSIFSLFNVTGTKIPNNPATIMFSTIDIEIINESVVSLNHN